MGAAVVEAFGVRRDFDKLPALTLSGNVVLFATEEAVAAGLLAAAVTDTAGGGCDVEVVVTAAEEEGKAALNDEL